VIFWNYYFYYNDDKDNTTLILFYCIYVVNKISDEEKLNRITKQRFRKQITEKEMKKIVKTKMQI
jgi:hypothetical protein